MISSCIVNCTSTFPLQALVLTFPPFQVRLHSPGRSKIITTLVILRKQIMHNNREPTIILTKIERVENDNSL